MLKHLIIKNYALIQNLDVDFNQGLTAITGETGAGKSILLGALSLILGERADTRVLKNTSQKCIIEGTFDLKDTMVKILFEEHDLDYEHISYFRREITTSGKSRAFINDTPVNLQVMKIIAGKLIDIHSQHESLLVGSSAFQFDVLDSWANLLEKTEIYRNLFYHYQARKKELRLTIQEDNSAKADFDYYLYQYEELEKVKITHEDYASMEEELEILKHAEEINQALEKSRFLLTENEFNITDTINEVLNLFQPLTRFGKSWIDIKQRLDALLIETKDIAEEINRSENDVEFDPQRIAILEDTLDQVNKLLMKHRVAKVSELSDLKQSFLEKINVSKSLEDKIITLKKEIEEAEKDLHALAEEISETRKAAIPEMQKEILGILISLGMPGARFLIKQEKTDHLTANGKDQIRFMFNANVGGQLEDIARVASGGELSRVMLSIKSMISRKQLLPTIIFDEIDTGISGESSNKVANILQKMSGNMQVIAITHLPQIASRGDTHLLVYKFVEEGETQTNIAKLTTDQRIGEVAKMLGGEKPTKFMVETAKELIFNKKNQISK